MSRTLKDRPYWVRVNDPKSSRRNSHKHHVMCREKVGEEPVYRRVPDKDGWHWHDELLYMRPIYRLWTEEVPCTIDMPEGSPSSWRTVKRYRTDEEFNNHQRTKKNCYRSLTFDGDYVSGKDFKRLTHSAERSKVRTQLHNAVRDNGSWVEDTFWLKYFDEDEMPEYPWPEYIDWEDVDIHNDSKYASRGWWDW